MPVGPQQDRYIAAILDLEQRGLLDEYTSTTIKTLSLEENFEIQRVINSYLAHVISDKELSFKLARLAQQLGPYHERPQSPLPKRKQELMAYLNQLARYHFTDPDDIQLLQKLIHDENEFMLSTFDVFESDKDHENLIDSLQRILDKSKTMGLHLQSVQASSFFSEAPSAWPRFPAPPHSSGPQPTTQRRTQSNAGPPRRRTHRQCPFNRTGDIQRPTNQSEFEHRSMPAQRPATPPTAEKRRFNALAH